MNVTIEILEDKMYPCLPIFYGDIFNINYRKKYLTKKG